MTIIEKIIAPSNNMSTKEEFGTVWIADLEFGKDIWIQTSEDKEVPKWKRLGALYEQVFLKCPSSQDIMLQAVLFSLKYRGNPNEPE